MPGSLIVIGILAFLVLLTILWGVRIVPQGYKHVVQRLGKYHSTLNPGLNFVIPYLDAIAYKVLTKDISLDIPTQEVITRDNAVIMTNAIAFINVIDPQKAVYGIDDFRFAIINLITDLAAQHRRRDGPGRRALLPGSDQGQAQDGDLRRRRRRGGSSSRRSRSRTSSPRRRCSSRWSSRPAAERFRRAAITEAEGKKAAAILNAEGAKEAAIREAEGKLEASRREAEAKIIMAEATKEAIVRVTPAHRRQGAAGRLPAGRALHRGPEGPVDLAQRQDGAAAGRHPQDRRGAPRAGEIGTVG